MFNYEEFLICKNIPDDKTIEALQTEDRLPKEVNELQIIGGNISISQLRKCPQCGTYYIFIHDHDSESGVGYGHTDESIKRIDPISAQRLKKEKMEGFESTELLKQELEDLRKNYNKFAKIYSNKNKNKNKSIK